MSESKSVLTLTDKEARIVHDAIADVICWFQGFAAATSKKDVHYPDGLEELRTFKMLLNGAVWPNDDTGGRL